MNKLITAIALALMVTGCARSITEIEAERFATVIVMNYGDRHSSNLDEQRRAIDQIETGCLLLKYRETPLAVFRSNSNITAARKICRERKE